MFFCWKEEKKIPVPEIKFRDNDNYPFKRKKHTQQRKSCCDIVKASAILSKKNPIFVYVKQIWERIASPIFYITINVHSKNKKVLLILKKKEEEAINENLLIQELNAERIWTRKESNQCNDQVTEQANETVSW